MRQATGLRGNLICIHQAMQRRKNRGNCRHRVRRRIHANDGVSATVEQSLEHRQKDASDVICWVIGLEANTQHFAFSHRVAAAGNVANPGGGEDEILVAHQFGYCGRDLRDDGPLNLLDLNVRGCVVQEEFAKLADRHAPYHTESFLVEGFQDEACDIVLRWIDQGTSDNLPERQVCESSLGRDSLSFRSRGNPSQLVARFFLIGFGKQFAEVGEIEALDHASFPDRNTMLSKKVAGSVLPFVEVVVVEIPGYRFCRTNGWFGWGFSS